MSKNEFISYAKRIKNSCRAIDSINDILEIELWESPMGHLIDTTIELLAISMGLDIKDFDLMDGFFDLFSTTSIFNNDIEEFWGEVYDNVIRNKESFNV